ncbi:unnamed protein product [Rangifer tarandus platyrhynchus]|uniref:Glutaredoxin domain-containing protein n=1 Tax=Rangifer tarandus platyrhynchus TaxID=3082113 RepID=A0ABN8XI84_RANTA|nr:unnamed protein product [Rangifer tarandus platyrhynchus]
MMDCCQTSIPSKEEVPKHVDCLINGHKVVLFTRKDEKSERVADVLKDLDVKDLCIQDVEKCNYKDEVLEVLAKKTATSATPMLFIGGEPYCGAHEQGAPPIRSDRPLYNRRVGSVSNWPGTSPLHRCKPAERSYPHGGETSRATLQAERPRRVAHTVHNLSSRFFPHIQLIIPDDKKGDEIASALKSVEAKDMVSQPLHSGDCRLCCSSLKRLLRSGIVYGINAARVAPNNLWLPCLRLAFLRHNRMHALGPSTTKMTDRNPESVPKGGPEAFSFRGGTLRNFVWCSEWAVLTHPNSLERVSVSPATAATSMVLRSTGWI